MFTIKVGRKEYQITSQDRFMDNGACVQLLTQKGPFKNWHHQTPTLSKREIARLSKLRRIEHKHKCGAGVSIFSVDV